MDENFYKKLKLKIKPFLVLLMAVAIAMPKANAAVDWQTRTERLETVLKKIEQQYRVSFVYDATEINKNLDIKVVETSKTVDLFLQQLGSYGIAYKVVGNKVILKKSASTLKDTPIKGKVVEKTGSGKESIPGVTVMEKGTKNVVSTGPNGDFAITVKDGAVLLFTAVGYKTKEVVVGSQTTIEVVMEANVNNLSEVVVTGYQSLDKKLFTGAATTLKGEDVKRDGISDVSRMLEGRVAGVSVQNVSGTFGAAPKIRVRGATSISGDNKPLFVVDGIVLEDVVNISNEALSTGDANTLVGSSVAGLNPDDIESFTILKDAAATAQYGARAMNGVVIITTKKGKDTKGKPNVSYTGEFTSYLKPSYSTYDILNSADQMNVYLEMRDKGWLNEGVTANNANGGVFTKMYNTMYSYNAASDSYVLRNDAPSEKQFLQRYANGNTNWFDVLFKNSLQMQHSLSVTSGTEKSQLYASTSFLKDNGWTIGDNVSRFTGSLRGTFKISDKLSFELLTLGSVRDQAAPGTLSRVSNPVFGQYDRDFDINPFSYAINTSRVLTAYDANGGLEYFTRDYAPFNIVSELKNNTLNLTQIDFKGQIGVKYKVLKQLQYSFDGAYRFAKTNQEHKVTENSNQANAYRAGINPANATIMANNRFLYHDPDSPDGLPVTVLPYGGFYNTVGDNITNYYFRNALEWNTTFNKDHLVNVFAAQELRYIDRQHVTFDGYGYQYDQGGVPYIDPNIVKSNVESNLNYYSMGYTYERYLNYQLRAAYSYKGKYSLNSTVRYDGSNLLGESPTARWLPTWNVSGAWNMDLEDFYQKSSLIKTLNRVTWRATYGLTASLGPATNSSLVLQSQSTSRPVITEKETALYIKYLENSQLTFEKQYETNLGVDLGFLQDRITLTVDVYDRKGFDLIGKITTSGIGGEADKIANYANMRSKGIEVTIGATPVKHKDFTWNTNLNFAKTSSKITNLQSQPTIFDLVNQDGGPQLGYPQRGLFSIDFVGLSHDRGIPQFIKEDGTVGTNVYLQSIVTKYLKYEGPVDPTLTGGFFNSFKYKQLSLGVLVTFSAGNKVRLDPVFKSSYTDLDATSSIFLKRWEKPGDELTTNVPSILDKYSAAQLDGYPYNNYNYSSARVADGGFVRLKTVSLSYAIKPQYLAKLGITNAALSFATNNVWLIYSDSALNGKDPEFFGSGGVALPIPRQFTLSLKVGF
ncbi:TonB-linked SusC/RagA family outer membrane protein [Mucilaginibacter gracilis]|uniref:TonB-linked SusC/RagA family outer membrane protein n=1 Tax=Mucilaginibacter gracilis TaxID=423350 RepID=A0A495IYK3_9SPHI|nr:SusC/RagA family TonB-linked outer membrane protein [Mucilaginibacter gracilis]RKR81461.1 TonB-linked SusC/RagA family outer membrane protein [Mucilaginibacter gracilis]